MTHPADITRILAAAGGGDPHAAEELLPLVYGQLRAIAQQMMNGERRDHTLQATAVVHEAYLRLVGDAPVTWDGRRHFYGAAAEAMRRILIEHARRRGRVRHGGGRRKMPLSVLDLVDAPAGQVLDLDDVLRRFEQRDPRAAEVVRLRFFAGLSIAQTAEVLGLSPRTVKRDWEMARAWLFVSLRKQGGMDQRQTPAGSP
jgi:RNA polymerase sigma factor (TIGR02999 family)